jgi:predicted RNA-binding protein YlxR (DUF448 family)
MPTNSARSHQAQSASASIGARQAARARQPLRPRHVPQRTCVACRSATAKRELIRLVRTPDGHVEVDPTGKKAGRGAYLCGSGSCWELALKKDRLSVALKARISADDAGQLRAYASALPAD